MDVRDAIVSAGKELGYARLKDKQMEAVTTFMQGKDVFCVSSDWLREVSYICSAAISF